MTTRPAIPADVPAIFHLVDKHARRGGVLPRSTEEIQASLSAWMVAVDKRGQVVACGMLAQYTPWLAEIRSLVVEDAFKSNGWGSKVVQALVAKACQQQIPVVFALTRAVPFFEKLGFSVVSLDDFPEKARHDCERCPRKECCDETAVALRLGEPGDAEALALACHSWTEIAQQPRHKAAH
jgi:amino-acid N-acetyltransferase